MGVKGIVAKERLCNVSQFQEQRLARLSAMPSRVQKGMVSLVLSISLGCSSASRTQLSAWPSGRGRTCGTAAASCSDQVQSRDNLVRVIVERGDNIIVNYMPSFQKVTTQHQTFSANVQINYNTTDDSKLILIEVKKNPSADPRQMDARQTSTLRYGINYQREQYTDEDQGVAETDDSPVYRFFSLPDAPGATYSSSSYVSLSESLAELTAITSAIQNSGDNYTRVYFAQPIKDYLRYLTARMAAIPPPADAPAADAGDDPTKSSDADASERSTAAVLQERGKR